MQAPVRSVVIPVKELPRHHYQNTGKVTDVFHAAGNKSFTASSKNIAQPNKNYSVEVINNSSRSSNSVGHSRNSKNTGKKLPNQKQSTKRRKNCIIACRVVSVVLLALLILGIIMIPIELLIIQKTTTTTTSTATIASTNSPTTLAAATTSIASTNLTNSATAITNATTAPATTVSTTIPVATATITSNICTSNWSAIQMVANCINCPYLPFYYHYIRNYTATGPSSVIAFAFWRNTGYFALDSVSVQSFTAPGVELIINGGFETGSLTSWTYCNQNNGSNTGGVQSNSSNFNYAGFTYYSQAGFYYYIGGSTTSADYISQTFATVTGQLYAVSFWIIVAGGVSQTSADLFLGV